MKPQSQKHLVWLVALILVASGIRLIQGFPPNFNPIGALALFGAAYLPKKWLAYAVPILAIWIGNIVLNNTAYSEYFESFYIADKGLIFMALSFVLIVAFGLYVLRKVSIRRILIGALGGGLIFFIASNFFVWAEGVLYPRTAMGLFECYVAGVPFFRNTIMGNLVFSAVLFGSYALATRQQLNWTAAKA